VLFFGTAYRCGAGESRGSVLGFDHGKWRRTHNVRYCTRSSDRALNAAAYIWDRRWYSAYTLPGKNTSNNQALYRSGMASASVICYTPASSTAHVWVRYGQDGKRLLPPPAAVACLRMALSQARRGMAGQWTASPRLLPVLWPRAIRVVPHHWDSPRDGSDSKS